MPRVFPNGSTGRATAILTRGTCTLYLSANAAKSGKSVNPTIGKMARKNDAGLSAVAFGEDWRLFTPFSCRSLARFRWNRHGKTEGPTYLEIVKQLNVTNAAGVEYFQNSQE